MYDNGEELLRSSTRYTSSSVGRSRSTLLFRLLLLTTGITLYSEMNEHRVVEQLSGWCEHNFNSTNAVQTRGSRDSIAGTFEATNAHNKMNDTDYLIATIASPQHDGISKEAVSTKVENPMSSASQSSNSFLLEEKANNRNTTTERKVKLLPSHDKDAPVSTSAPTAPINVSSLMQIVNNVNMSIVEKAAALPDMKVGDPAAISVYSSKALFQLDRVKEKLKQENNGPPTVLVVNGGSSSAGGPDIRYEDRYFKQFANRIGRGRNTSTSTNETNSSISIVDRAHGSRNTIHSAQLMHSFMPEKVDILIWEFAINDAHKGADVRNQLILWLRNVEATIKSPPLVLLVYLWNSPFQLDNNGKVLCEAFEHHKKIAAEYDFVLGHVNMAAYMDSLHINDGNFNTLKTAFVADQHHPNALFHHVIAKSVWQLFASPHPERTTTRALPTSHEQQQERRTDLEWICGTETLEQRQVFELFNATGGIVRGSYTAELPRNNAGTARSGMIVLPSESSLQFHNFGIANPERSDRQLGILLPCCNVSDNPVPVVEFNVSSFGYIRALMLTFRCTEERRRDLRVIFDGGGVVMASNTTDSLMIRPSAWDCLLGGYNIHLGDLPSLDVDLALLSRRVQTIGFCDEQCHKSEYLPMLSMSVF